MFEQLVRCKDTRRNRTLAFFMVLAVPTATGGDSGSSPAEPYNPASDPADFVVAIDNPHYALTSGTVFIYGGQGELSEVTLDGYAQDKEGNVWHFDEASKSFENGHVVSDAFQNCLRTKKARGGSERSDLVELRGEEQPCVTVHA